MTGVKPAFVPTSLWVGQKLSTNRRSVVHCGRKCDLQMRLISHEKLESLFGEEGPGEIAKYKLVLEIPGTYSREQRKKSLADLKKNANFPGFRKGTIPPFIKQDVDAFVLEDSISRMISEACVELDLKPIEGEKGGPEMDLDEMKPRFKVGTDFQFECFVPLETEDKLISGGFLNKLSEVEVDSLPIDKSAGVTNS